MPLVLLRVAVHESGRMARHPLLQIPGHGESQLALAQVAEAGQIVGDLDSLESQPQGLEEPELGLAGDVTETPQTPFWN